MTLSTSPFLDLYPEIRQLIYMLHLTTPYQHTPDVAGLNNQNRLPGNPRDWDEKCILYPYPSDSKPRNLALLLLNKQINAEISSFTDFLVQHSPSSLRYELDIDIVNERKVYPTWTLIPIRWKEGSPIPVVHATFRNTGQCIQSEWAHGNGGVYPMLWNLLKLLEGFLHRGPEFIALSKVPGDTDRILPTQVDANNPSDIPRIRIETLILDVVSPELPPGQSFLPPFVSGWPMRNWGKFIPRMRSLEELIPELHPDLVGKVVHPKDVVKWMGNYLNYMLNSPPTNSEHKYAQYIRPRVGCISLRCDGEENHVWNLWED